MFLDCRCPLPLRLLELGEEGALSFVSRRIKLMPRLGPAPCRQWSTSLAFALDRGKRGAVDCHSVVSEMRHLAIEMPLGSTLGA